MHLKPRPTPPSGLSSVRPTRSSRPGASRDGLHEIKHDGFRIIAGKSAAEDRRTFYFLARDRVLFEHLACILKRFPERGVLRLGRF